MNITNREVSAFAGSETSPSCLGLGMWSWDCTWFCGPAFDLDGTIWSPDMYELWGGGSPFSIVDPHKEVHSISC